MISFHIVSDLISYSQLFHVILSFNSLHTVSHFIHIVSDFVCVRMFVLCACVCVRDRV